MYDFDSIINRRGTGSIKWDRYPDSDVIPMWIADMDFKAPLPVLSALEDDIEHGIFGYSQPKPELIETVLTYLKISYNWEISPEWIVWLPGVVTALNATCRAFCADGESAFTTTPIYPPFLSAPSNFDRELITVPLHDESGYWRFYIDEFERAIKNHTRLFMLCNPHNPTGRVYTKAELTEIAGHCIRHDMIICSDEIHCDLIMDDLVHLPIATLNSEVADRTVTLMAPSKTFNIPGLGCSFAIIPNHKLRRTFLRATRGIVPETNSLGYTACLAAYKQREPWLKELLTYLRANRDLAFHTINEKIGGMSMNKVEATYLAWIDCRALDLPDACRFFEDAGVGMSNGKLFRGDGYLRLNYGCPRALLEEALNRIVRAL